MKPKAQVSPAGRLEVDGKRLFADAKVQRDINALPRRTYTPPDYMWEHPCPAPEYAHMCRMDHKQIGYNDSESEQCPVCSALGERYHLRADLSDVLEALRRLPLDWLLKAGAIEPEDWNRASAVLAKHAEVKP